MTQAPPPTTATLEGPGTVPVHLRVNGRPYDLRLPPHATLLDTLRDTLGLTGTKKVCDMGQCGACTVLCDGVAVYACLRLAIESQGCEITTIEGLQAPDGTLHPIQEKFVECDALQCSFCTAGQVLALKALLDRNPDPTPDEIRRGLAGNLCRCGAYAGIMRAAQEAARALAPAPAGTPSPDPL
jgi:aerobic-type carbon monoxide dehydrogenase small subunit (CoxS/CutS family)